MTLAPVTQPPVGWYLAHVDESDAYEPADGRSVGYWPEVGTIRYQRAARLSTAAEWIADSTLVAFVLDWRLPEERPGAFMNWGTHPRTTTGLIERIRSERPDLPVLVLTNFSDDKPLKDLINRRELEIEDVFDKGDFADDWPKLLERARRSRVVLEPRLRWQLQSAQRLAATGGTIPVTARVSDLPSWEKVTGIAHGIAVPRRAGSEWIVTARVPPHRVEEIGRLPFLQGLAAARPVRPDLHRTVEETAAAPLQLPALTSGEPGRGAIVGIVDFGCDFAHPNFRQQDGKTRLLALWDQAQGDTGVHTREQIDAALQTAAPYKALGYRPELSAHGTHVMDIAAGGGRGTGVAGIAPGAELIFVCLAGEASPADGRRRSSLSDSTQLMNAVEFIFRQAGDRPCVVNLSLATDAGPHDGSSIVEVFLDEMLGGAPDRAIVIAAGNTFDAGIHVTGHVGQDGSHEISWQVRRSRQRQIEIEGWYSPDDDLTVELIDPRGKLVSPPLAAGDPDVELTGRAGAVGGLLSHVGGGLAGEPAQVLIAMGPALPAGEWRLRLRGRRVIDGTFHAWMERYRDRTARFLEPVDRSFTLGSIACGREPIVVGSYDATSTGTPLSAFTSAGPTRDGRQKPELSAPGQAVQAACSRRGTQRIPLSGTSMAAPAVTGVVALMLAEAKARGLHLSMTRIREILRAAARVSPPDHVWHERYGWGRIEARAAIQAIHRLPS